MNTERLFNPNNLDANISITIRMQNGAHTFTMDEARALHRSLGLLLGNVPAAPLSRTPVYDTPIFGSRG